MWDLEIWIDSNEYVCHIGVNLVTGISNEKSSIKFLMFASCVQVFSLSYKMFPMFIIVIEFSSMG